MADQLPYVEPSSEQLDAESYRLLAEAIQATMSDPDVWDGDEAEPALMIRYVQYLATATHGDCVLCREPIKADEFYEDAGEGRSRGRAHCRCIA